ENAIRWIGAVPVRVGGPRPLLHHRPAVDLIWNISEGYGSKNREGWVPLICDVYRIPCLGSDAFTMNLSLDKSATKKVAQSLGMETSAWGIGRYKDGFEVNYIHQISQKVMHKIALYASRQMETDLGFGNNGGHLESDEKQLNSINPDES